VEPGVTYRFRVTSAATLGRYLFSIENHNFSIIEIDGTDVEMVTVSSFRLNIGQRVSILLHADADPSQSYCIRVDPSPDKGGLAARAILKYSTATKDCNPDGQTYETELLSLPTQNGDFLTPIPALNASLIADQTFELEVTFDLKDFRYYVNGRTQYLPPPVPALFQAYSHIPFDLKANVINAVLLQGQSIRIIFSSNTSDEHPLHLHGHTFFVLASSNGTFDENSIADFVLINPMRRDVITIPPNGWVAIQFVVDNPGTWIMHCHIEFHILSGFGIVWNEDPDGLGILPSDMPLCGGYTELVQTTQNPTTDAPTTADPTTSNPTTANPTTANPTTADPTTSNPTTANPTTANPTTASPTTANPTTASPTTASPTTANPTTASPTTASPTTASPTTANPTTASPTTASPTTASPTTASPTTANPTTANPTTANPTTANPTTANPTDLVNGGHVLTYCSFLVLVLVVMLLNFN